MNEQQIFCAAIEILDPEARRTYVNNTCGQDTQLSARINELLAIHGRENGVLDRPVDGITPVQEGIGEFVGAFRLIQRIGEGGFGVVYLAEQSDPVQRSVAIKVIKAGMDTKQVLRRFDSERRTLAMMDHHCIASFLDAGTTRRGRPFFAMEYVDGIPVTEFADEHRLTIRKRLELFSDICSALQHAHQKGIIHRDLKPSNVLVRTHEGRPVPKVIDFGIAKATQKPTHVTDQAAFTSLLQFMGTPEYVSPEQATAGSRDIDTRSDIYSLGVILYELLTGTTPVQRSSIEGTPIDEVVRIIRDVEPPTPSQRLTNLDEQTETILTSRQSDRSRLHRTVKGELDWITAKALEKDPNRRYDSAAALADDVQRFLRSEPVLAKPATFVYRCRKFIQRNRGLVAALITVFGTLIVGLVASTLGFISASRSQSLAKIELQRNRELMYVSDVNRAQNELRVGNTELAVTLLKRQIPTTSDERDLRSFPWYYLWEKCKQSEFVVNHEAPVHDVAYTKDGKVIISVGEEIIRFWDAETGEKLDAEKSSIDTITGLAVIDEQTLVIGGGTPWSPERSAVLELWDLNNRRMKSQHQLSDYHMIHTLAACPDGEHVAFAGKDGHFGIWNVERQSVVVGRNEPSLGHIWSMVFGQAGKTLFTSSMRTSSNEFSVQQFTYWHWSGRSLKRRTAKSTLQRVRSVDVHPDGKTVAAVDVGFDPHVSLIYLDDKASERLELTNVRKCEFTPNGEALLLGRFGSFDVFNLSTKTVPISLRGHTSGITAIAQSSKAGRVATGGHDETVRQWDLTKHEKPEWEKADGRVDAWVFSHDDKYVVSCALQTGVEIYDVETGTLVTKLDEGEGRTATFSADDSMLAVGFADGELIVWETKNWEPVCSEGKLPDRPMYIAFSDSLSCVEALTLPTIDEPERTWSLQLDSGEVVKNLQAKPLGMRPTSGRDVPGFRKYRHYNGNRMDRTSISPKGKYLASGFGSLIEVWDLESRTRQHILQRHRSPVALSFAPDGEHIISFSECRRIIVWNLRTGKSVVELRGHTAPTQCGITSDLRTLAVGFLDGSVVCYDLLTEQPILTLNDHVHTAQTVQFSHDGRTLATGAWSGERRVYRSK